MFLIRDYVIVIEVVYFTIRALERQICINKDIGCFFYVIKYIEFVDFTAF